MRGRVLMALGLLLAGCTGGDDDPSPPEAVPDPRGITAEQVRPVRSCAELHDAVLAWLDAAAERSRALLGDVDALEVWVDSVVAGSGPVEGLEAVEGLHPSLPYGGIAGTVATDRYEELGCSPEDELPVLLGWFGLAPGTPPSLDDDSPLREAVRERIRDDGGGGWVALGLGRRLGEGAALADSPLMEALADVARAQAAYHRDHGRYADDLALLRSYLDDESLIDSDDPDAPLVLVTAASADAYCVHGADGPSAVVESHDGIPRNRVPGSPSCPNTFPDIDDAPAE